MAGINEKIVLQDQASATLKKVANEANKTATTFDKLKGKLSLNDSKIGSGFKDLGSKFDGLKDKFASTFPSFSKSLNGVGGIIGDIAKINPAITAGVAAIGAYTAAMKGYFALTNEYLNAYQGQFEAETRLASASLNRRGTGDVSDIVSEAGRIQSRGIVGDETLVGGATRLMSAGFTKEANKFQSTIADMMVFTRGFNATGADAEKAGLAISKALNGQIRGLQEYGVYVDADTQKRFKTMNAMERSQFVQDALTKAVGGTNEAYTKTSLGIKKSFENTFGDIKENVGTWVSDAIGSIYSVFTKYTPLMSRIGDIFGRGLNIAGNALAALTDIVFSIGEAIWNIGSAIFSPFTELFGGYGEIIGLGGDLTEQISKTIRVIGINISYFAKMIGGIASLVGDGFTNIADTTIWAINKMFATIADALPDSIKNKFDFLSKADERARQREQSILDRSQKSVIDKLSEGFDSYVKEVTDVMTGDVGKADPFNALLGALKDIGKDTKNIDTNTRKIGEIDEEYLNNVRDYFVTRNTWNTSNSQIDNRQYSIQMAGKNLNGDISNDIDDVLGAF